jgi:hypothetical protein
MFNMKKMFMKRLLKQTEASIWTDELARYITLYDRERERQMIDKCSDVLHRIKANKDTPQADIDAVEKELKQHTEMVDQIDEVLDGRPESEDKHGLVGINKRLEAQVEKREHIKNFIKHYC